jgi:hypothetical protein
MRSGVVKGMFIQMKLGLDDLDDLEDLGIEL